MLNFRFFITLYFTTSLSGYSQSDFSKAILKFTTDQLNDRIILIFEKNKKLYNSLITLDHDSFPSIFIDILNFPDLGKRDPYLNKNV